MWYSRGTKKMHIAHIHAAAASTPTLRPHIPPSDEWEMERQPPAVVSHNSSSAKTPRHAQDFQAAVPVVGPHVATVEMRARYSPRWDTCGDDFAWLLSEGLGVESAIERSDEHQHAQNTSPNPRSRPK